jgi:hypothetical protein
MTNLSLRIVKAISKPVSNIWLNLTIFSNDIWKIISTVVLVELIFLSHEIYDEFLVIMADHLRKSFSDEVKNATYFYIIVDSTPDVSHVDQLSVILRYVKPDGQITERFFSRI